MEISNQLEIINPASIGNDIELTATLPHEMINAQQQLITWCDGKICFLKKESQELLESTEHAKKMKWKSATLQGQYNRSLKRLSYYEKIKGALIEGYYIVPNFPIHMFAIRTKRDDPLRMYSNSYWNTKEQDAQELPQNEGEYKNPFPYVSRHSGYKDGNNNQIEPESYATAWDDFEFPITMAKPMVMEATSRAMALKIFDQIGIMPIEKKRDPVIIGQIINKVANNTRTISFMIAWHLNTNVI